MDAKIKLSFMKNFYTYVRGLCAKKKRTRTFLTASILLAVVGIIFFYVSLSSSTYTIRLEADGFHPSELIISEGDTVTFTTNTGEAFWPASNVHPSHTDYSAFDPRKPVAEYESWSFTFTESGTYKFHDHIKPLFTGVIKVKDAQGDISKIDCTDSKNTKCWEESMLQILEEKGVGAAFDKLTELSETEPSFGSDCHGYSHLIGEKAYSLYAAKENFELTPSTALCGYGFYHGFMQTLLQTTGDIQEARDFCSMADQKLLGQTSAASIACFHGTGHGAVDGSDPTAWGDIDAMMNPGFKMCTALAENDLQHYLCDTGVFNAIEILSHDTKYKIDYIQDDPFLFCNGQTVERREACYSNMLPLLLSKFHNNFDEIFSYINENMIDNNYPAIDGHDVNGLVTLGVMFEFVRVHGGEPDYMEQGVDLCRKQPEEDRLPCIEGISGGHLKYGPPQKEYIKNIAFCKLDVLTDAERDSCYLYLLPRLDSRYGENKAREICQTVAVDYREKYCRYY